MSETTITTETITDMSAPDLQRTIDGYFECWNATDPAARGAALERVWAEHARSVDPMYEATGHDQLAAMFAGFHVEYPGSSFRQQGGVDEHHGLVRWGWEMVDPDGNVVLDGLDVAGVNADGRIDHLVGFFGAALPSS